MAIFLNPISPATCVLGVTRLLTSPITTISGYSTTPPLLIQFSGLPPGLISNSGGSIAGTPTVAGTWTIQGFATDASYATVPFAFQLTVTTTVPAISSPTSVSGAVGTPLTRQIVASGAPTSYSWVAPNIGLSLNTLTGAISGTPNTSGAFNITLRASNAAGTGSRVVPFTIAAAPPVITSPLTAAFYVGQPSSYIITATNSPSMFAASGLPPGMTLSGATISGTPTTVGTYSVSISASNGGGTATRTLAITVALAPPVISSFLNASATVGVPFSYQITATNNPTSFNALNMPFGLSVNPTTGLITGTISSIGSSNITLQATNAGGTGSNTLYLTQMAPPPAITSALTKAGARGVAFSYQITATNSPTSFAVVGVLPTGLTLNLLNGFITGVPLSQGNASVSIQAFNSYGSDQKTLAILIAGTPPVIQSPLTASCVQGVPFLYQIAATNDPTSYAATGLPPGMGFNVATGEISGVPEGQGTTNVVISATNIDGTDTQTLAIYVSAPPVITSALAVNGTTVEAFSYFITATNNPTTFGGTGFPAGLNLNTVTGEISGTPSAPGLTTAVISATNVDGSDIKNLDFTVVVRDPPVITSVLAVLGTQNVVFSYFVTATNNPTVYGAPAGLPVGLSLNTLTGEISGTPTVPGLFNVLITAGNSAGFDTRTLTFDIPAEKPLITSSLTDSGQQGHPFTYTIVATNSPSVYGASPLPEGLSIDTNTGTISGVPAIPGVYNITISASNTGGTDYQTLELNLAPGIPKPTITSSLTARTIQNQPFAYQITTDVVPLSYGASGLPAGLSINTATGLIGGTPTATGQSYILMTATNATGTGNATLILDVVIEAPVITSSLLEQANQFSAFTYQIVATHSPTDYTAVGLPLGLSVNPTTGLITGTTNGAAGISYVLITATNAGGTDTKTLLINVNEFIPPPPVINSSLTASVLRGQPFTYTITATNAPESFTATGLPAGLHLNSATGFIYGTPTAAAATNVTITATNMGGTDTQVLVVTVSLPVLKTIWGDGVLTSRRTAILGSGFVIDTKTGTARQADVTRPLDEAVISVFPVNAPGGLFAGQYPPDSSTASTG